MEYDKSRNVQSQKLPPVEYQRLPSVEYRKPPNDDSWLLALGAGAFVLGIYLIAEGIFFVLIKKIKEKRLYWLDYCSFGWGFFTFLFFYYEKSIGFEWSIVFVILTIIFWFYVVNFREIMDNEEGTTGVIANVFSRDKSKTTIEKIERIIEPVKPPDPPPYTSDPGYDFEVPPQRRK